METVKDSHKPAARLPVESVISHIRVLREQKVLLDSDLAPLYGVTTGAPVQAVKRNLDRFPPDFMFQLDAGEWQTLRSQNVISNGRRHPREGGDP